MANFDSGVKRYIIGRAVVENSFPVDFKDNPDISCRQCDFFVSKLNTCGLTGKVVEYPLHYVGSTCPLERVEEEEDQNGTEYPE